MEKKRIYTLALLLVMLAACSKEEIKAPTHQQATATSMMQSDNDQFRKAGDPVWRWLVQGRQNIHGFVIYLAPFCEGIGGNCLDGFEVVSEDDEKAYNNFLDAIEDVEGTQNYFASDKWKKLFLGLNDEQVSGLATGELKVVQEESFEADHTMFLVIDSNYAKDEVDIEDVKFALTLKIK